MYCSQWGFGYLVPSDLQRLPLEVQMKVSENKGRALYFRAPTSVSHARRSSKVRPWTSKCT